MKLYDTSGGCGLNNACTYKYTVLYRKDAVTLLLKFGAQPGIRNGKNESTIDIVNKHPEHRQADFMKLFRGNVNKTTPITAMTIFGYH